MTDDPAQAIRLAVVEGEVLSSPTSTDPAPASANDDEQASSESSGGDDGQGPKVDPGVLRECAGLDQNDTDNGRRLLLHFSDDILFVREVGWHAWTGTHWEVEGGDERVQKLAQETARRIKLEPPFFEHGRTDKALVEAAEHLRGKDYSALSDAEKETLKAADKARDRLSRKRSDRKKFGISSGNRSRTVAMIAQAAPHRTVAPSVMDAHPRLFNLQNGTLVFSRKVTQVDDPDCPDPDVRRTVDRIDVSITLRQPHRRDDLIAKIAPLRFDEKAKSPRWSTFMERFQPDATQRRFLQVAAGRALLGGASTQVLIFLYGDGANGKSAFMETLAQMLGAYAGRLKPESITGAMEQSGDKATPDFARLTGKRFVAIAELPKGAPLREGLVKTMTGSEPMPVRHLNHGFFDLVPEFIPFMSGNQMPEISGLDRGIWRRIKFVHWPVTIPDDEQKPLPVVVAEHLEESSGILNWLIDGARIFLREGLVDPPAVKKLGEEHRSDLDPVGNFTRHCVVEAMGKSVQARAMYQAFLSFCAANSIRPWKEKSFSLAMKQKGFTRQDSRIRVWIDVSLQDVPAMPDEEPRSPNPDEVIE